MLTPDPLNLFDRKSVRLHRNRAAPHIQDFDFLFAEVADRLTERLLDVKRTFPLALDIGCHGGEIARSLGARGGIETLLQCDLSPAMAQKSGGISFAADEEFLPIKSESLDLVLSNLSLHWVNDLPGAFVQIRQALKQDGFFMASMLGEHTLHQLRESLMTAETELEGGLSPRVSPYATVQDIGHLLQRAGFTMPVVDIDTITVSYSDMFKLMHDLRGMGETGSVSERRKNFTRRATLMRAAQHYMETFAGEGDVGEGRVPATFDIIFMTAWSPHPDQPKAAKPGSATVSLADFLEAE